MHFENVLIIYRVDINIDNFFFYFLINLKNKTFPVIYCPIPIQWENSTVIFTNFMTF